MLGKIIRQERLNKHFKSKDLAESVGIDTGHLSHIEKGIRNPSKTILAKLCEQLDLSQHFMLSLLQNTVDEESTGYDISTSVPYKKTLYAENLNLIDLLPEDNAVSLISRMADDSMEPVIKKDDYIYIQYASKLNNNDICIIKYDGKILVREFVLNSDDSFRLTPKNANYQTLKFDELNNSIQIIGRIIKNTSSI